MDIRTIIKTSKKKNLSGVAITDHNTTIGGQKAYRQNREQLLIIVGAEIATDIGDIIGLFLTEDVRSSDPHEVLDRIKSQDGISVFPHPFKGHKLADPNTIEILKKVDCVEILSSRSPIGLKEFQYLASVNHTLIAGSDAHFPVEIGLCRTLIDMEKNTDLDEAKRALLSHETVSVGAYGSPYLRAMSQIIKNFKFKRIKPIIPQTVSLIKEFKKQ